MSESHPVYVYLLPFGMDGVSSSRAWVERIRSLRCTGCHYLRPDVGALDIEVTSPPPLRPMSHLSVPSVQVVYRGFLDRLPKSVISADLLLGKVTDTRGRVMSDWVTVRGRRQCIVRGTKEASVRRCATCGRVLYFSIDETYVHPEPPSDASIFEVRCGMGLLVRHEVYRTLDLGKWRWLKTKQIPVVSDPPDGFGDLEQAATAERKGFIPLFMREKHT